MAQFIDEYNGPIFNTNQQGLAAVTVRWPALKVRKQEVLRSIVQNHGADGDSVTTIEDKQGDNEIDVQTSVRIRINIAGLCQLAR
jgi:hypothetical protein